jgi:hypothetical protein
VHLDFFYPSTHRPFRNECFKRPGWNKDPSADGYVLKLTALDQAPDYAFGETGSLGKLPGRF